MYHGNNKVIGNKKNSIGNKQLFFFYKKFILTNATTTVDVYTHMLITKFNIKKNKKIQYKIKIIFFL